MGTWAENGREYKREKKTDPVERVTRRRKPSDVTPTKKHLLDRMDQARRDYLRHIEWREEHGRDSWLARDIDYWRKRYELALKTCLQAGIVLSG